MKLKIKETKKLSRNDVSKILKIKNKHWKFGIVSQINWFNDKKNVQPNDLHIMIFNYKILVGYVQLSKRKMMQYKKKSNYILFRTLIVEPKYRKKNISKKIMQKVNQIIIRKKTVSFLLFCKKKLINFYSKFSWILSKKEIL